MEEILELKDYLVNQQYDHAFAIVEKLEAMGRQDKINNLESLLVILLIHLIKIQVGNRITRSWKNSVISSLLAIKKRNRLNNKYYYIELQQWHKYISACQCEAILVASRDVLEGIDYLDLEKLVDLEQLIIVAGELLALTYNLSPREIIEFIESRFVVGF